MIMASFEEHKEEKAQTTVVKEVILSCLACQTDLVQVIILKDTPRVNVVQAICPYCGERTFTKKFTGEGLIGTTNEKLVIADIKSDFNKQGNIDNILIEVKNVKK